MFRFVTCDPGVRSGGGSHSGEHAFHKAGHFVRAGEEAPSLRGSDEKQALALRKPSATVEASGAERCVVQKPL